MLDNFYLLQVKASLFKCPKKLFHGMDAPLSRYPPSLLINCYFLRFLLTICITIFVKFIQNKKAALLKAALAILYFNTFSIFNDVVK